MRINGIFGTISSAMALLAPAAAGLVFGVFGIVPVFFLDVVTAVIGIGILFFVTVPTLAAVSEKTTSYREDLVEGFRFIWHHPIVRWLLVVFALIFVLVVAPSFVTPLMIARDFGEEVWKLTVLELAFSVGMLLGGVGVSTFLAKRRRMPLILIATFSFAAFSIGLGLSPNLIVFYAFMFLFGLFVPLFSTPVMTLLQETVQPEMHGRVFSFVGIVMALATPVGIAVFGPLADVISVQVLLVAGGVAMAVVMTIAILVPSGRAAMAAARRTDPGAVPDAAQTGADADSGG
jgi:DHA3 family macrolide efflux protein-like MFS transporter